MSLKSALLEEYALVARAMASPARLKILEQVAQGAQSVERIADKTALSVANCSQHLQQLRRAGLVTNYPSGKERLYTLTDQITLELMDVLRRSAERNRTEVGRILNEVFAPDHMPEPVSRDELAARLATDSVLVIDLRPSDEYALSHIESAMNVTLDELSTWMRTINPAAEVVAYCRGPYCVYAHEAVYRLRASGFNANRLQGGLPEWQSEGYPVV